MGSYPTFLEWEVRQISGRQRAYLTIKAKKAPAPSKLRKLNKDKRRYLVDTVVKILKRGEPTLFAFEASCRTGIRQGLCLEGWGWRAADAAAADVVALALRLIGAQRPTWQQGQPEWAQDGHSPIKRTRCAHCGERLPESGSENDRKYCSQLCGSAAYKSGAAKWGVVVSRAEHLALKAAQSQRTKRERMELYGLREEHWRNDYHKRLRSERRAEARAGRQCPACGTVFNPDRADAKFCGRRCQQNAWQREKRASAVFKCEEVE